MNELAVRRTIKQVILDNEADLVQGLFLQGMPRSISKVTYSGLTPPTGYFFLSVTTTTNRDTNRRGFGRTTALTMSEAEYNVNIDISDYVVGTPGENQLFEKMDAEFQLFTDRLVSKLRENYNFTDSSGLQFKLDEDRTVTKNNLGTSWEEAAQYHALLYARITFTLIEECTDDSLLFN